MSYNMYCNWYLNYSLKNFLSFRHHLGSAKTSTQSQGRILQSCADTIQRQSNERTHFALHTDSTIGIYLTHLSCMQDSDETSARKPGTYFHIKEEMIIWGEYTNYNFSSWSNPKAYMKREVLITVIFLILIKLQWRELICFHLLLCEVLACYLLYEITERIEGSATLHGTEVLVSRASLERHTVLQKETRKNEICLILCGLLYESLRIHNVLYRRRVRWLMNRRMAKNLEWSCGLIELRSRNVPGGNAERDENPQLG
jgi:hypothetical protein